MLINKCYTKRMPAHTVILRRYSEETESDKYYPVGTVGSVTAANKLALQTSGEPGDILIVCDTAYVSDLPKYAKNIYVINAKGICEKARKVPIDIFASDINRNWLEVWEGDDFDLSHMTYFVFYKIGIPTTVEIAVECSRLSIPYAIDKEVILLSQQMANVADGFSLKKIYELRELQTELRFLRSRMWYKIVNVDAHILAILHHMANSITLKDVHDHLMLMVECSAVLGREQVAEIIRKHVPLRRILLTPSG